MARRPRQPLALFLLRCKEPSAGIPSYTVWASGSTAGIQINHLRSLCLSFLICAMGCPRTMLWVQILRDYIFFHPCLCLRPRGPHSCPDQAELGLKELSLGVLRGLRVWGQEEPQFNCY